MNETFFEETIARYERQFANGRTPDLQRFLSTLDVDCDDLFKELLHTDLELRIRNGQSSRVEHYLQQFPQLANDTDLIQELIHTEFKIRQQLEPGLKAEEYSIRFPERSIALLDQFANTTHSSPTPNTKFSSAHSRSFSDNNKRFRKNHLHRRGGLGNVWLAADQELGRTVAIKEIKPSFNNSPPHRSRFAREALITSQLDHPGVVSVYGMGQRLNGAPYFAMQFIDGRTLRTAIAAFHLKKASNKSLEFHRLLQHFLDVCNTIEYAHSQNIVHRDLKPDNIMIGQFGETFVVDWGLAKADLETPLASDENGSSSKEIANSFRAIVLEGDPKGSVEGTGIGSPGFMSPEQLIGDRDQIGTRSDIFSLGATLRSLIANEEQPIPNQRNDWGADEFTAAPLVPAKPSQLDSICQKAMAVDPDERYQTVAELAEDVENFLLNRPVAAHRESFGERAGRFSRRYRVILNTAIVAMIAISLVSLVAVFWINSERQNAIAASKAEFAQRQKAENRTDQLTKTIGVFADLFSGTDNRGVGLNLNKVTLQQTLDELDSRLSDQTDPVALTFLQTVLARNSISSGNPEQAIEQYIAALKLLQENEIKETDPLHLATTVGMCSAMSATPDLWIRAVREGERNPYSGSDPGEAFEKIERVIEICVRESGDHEDILFEALLTKVQLALLTKARSQLTKFDSFPISKLDKIVQRANQLGEKIFADSPDHIQLLRAKLLAAELLAYQGTPDKFFQTYGSLIDDWKSTQQIHSIIIAAEVKLAEYFVRFRQFPSALEQLEDAIEDAKKLYGESHPSTLTVQIRYANMLVFGNRFGEEAKIRGIGILEHCRSEQIRCKSYFAALQTTQALVPGLLEIGGPQNTNRAIDLCEELFPLLENCSGHSFAKIMRGLNLDLVVAYKSQNEWESARNSINDAIEYSTLAYGKESDKTISLMIQKQKLSKHAKAFVPSDTSKEFTRKIANLMVKGLHGDLDLDEVTATYQEFKLAWETFPAPDRPADMAMFYVTQELGKAHQAAGNIEDAIRVYTESTTFAEKVFGLDAPPILKLIEKINALKSASAK